MTTKEFANKARISALWFKCCMTKIKQGRGISDLEKFDGQRFLDQLSEYMESL